MVRALAATRYALITPVRDEERYIRLYLDSILQQTIRPASWVIVDDGSIDSTPAILAEYAALHDCLRVLVLPPSSQRRPGGEEAITSALKLVDLSDVAFLARFDGDISLCPDYIERLLEEFSHDQRLGIAGGGLYLETPAGPVLEKCPAYHVRGALKLYRTECFQAIGGLSAGIGWDTIDEISAWAEDWRTRTFIHVSAIHHKPTGSGLQRNRVFWERGRADYFTWSHPAFVLAKTIKLAVVDRLVLAAPYYLAGFLSCCLKRTVRTREKRFVAAQRKQQWRRIYSLGLARNA